MWRDLIARTQKQASDAQVLANGLEFSDLPSGRKTEANRELKLESAVPSLFLIGPGGVSGLMHTRC